MLNFPTNLKTERERISLSQTELGKKLNCSRYRIADLERGRITPTLEDINLLCDLFNISADYLIGRSEIRAVDSNKILDTIQKYTGLSENSIDFLHLPIEAIQNGAEHNILFMGGESPENIVAIINRLLESDELFNAVFKMDKCLQAAEKKDITECRISGVEASEELSCFMQTFRNEQLAKIPGINQYFDMRN